MTFTAAVLMESDNSSGNDKKDLDSDSKDSITNNMSNDQDNVGSDIKKGSDNDNAEKVAKDNNGDNSNNKDGSSSDSIEKKDYDRDRDNNSSSHQDKGSTVIVRLDLLSCVSGKVHSPLFNLAKNYLREVIAVTLGDEENIEEISKIVEQSRF